MNFIREDLNCVPVIVRFHLANRFLSALGKPASASQLLGAILTHRQNDNHLERIIAARSDSIKQQPLVTNTQFVKPIQLRELEKTIQQRARR
jgi:hypothetical protein